MKCKYEYVVQAANNKSYVESSREKARQTKRDCGGGTITQRKYKLVEEKVVR